MSVTKISVRPSGPARAAPLSHDDSASHSNLNKMLLVSPRCGRTDGVSGCIGEMRSSGDGDTLQPKTFLPSLSRARLPPPLSSLLFLPRATLSVRLFVQIASTVRAGTVVAKAEMIDGPQNS